MATCLPVRSCVVAAIIIQNEIQMPHETTDARAEIFVNDLPLKFGPNSSRAFAAP